MTEAKTPFEWNTAEQLVKTPQREPYDPEPRPLEKATNGWRWCEACAAPVEAAKHDCPVKPVEAPTSEDPTIATELERLATGHG